MATQNTRRDRQEIERRQRSKHSRRMIKRSKQRQRSERLRIYGRKPANCSYCGGEPRLVTEQSEKRELGLSLFTDAVWVCSNQPACDAAVWCHVGSTTPLGTLASKELRAARSRAHWFFDKLFEISQDPTRRRTLYAELAAYLELPLEETHIGMFGFAYCELVVVFSRQRLRKIYGKR